MRGWLRGSRRACSVTFGKIFGMLFSYKTADISLWKMLGSRNDRLFYRRSAWCFRKRMGVRLGRMGYRRHLSRHRRAGVYSYGYIRSRSRVAHAGIDRSLISKSCIPSNNYFPSDFIISEGDAVIGSGMVIAELAAVRYFRRLSAGISPPLLNIKAHTTISALY